MTTLTKAEISEVLYESLGLSRQDAKDVLEDCFEAILNSLEQGESVKVSGFGKFEVRDKKQRPGRNPKTGEAIPVTARRVVTFHAGQKLKQQVAHASPDAEGPDADEESM